jgi:hypothetical protein
VTKYVAAEDEPDDSMLDDQDESNDNTLGEEEVTASDEKREELEDYLLGSIDGEDKDLDSVVMEYNLLAMAQENLEDVDLEEEIKEPTEVEVNTRANNVF